MSHGLYHHHANLPTLMIISSSKHLAFQESTERESKTDHKLPRIDLRSREACFRNPTCSWASQNLDRKKRFVFQSPKARRSGEACSRLQPLAAAPGWDDLHTYKVRELSMSAGERGCAGPPRAGP